MTHPPEWYANRRGRITASLVGAILGHGPYMTRDDALRSMVRDQLGAEREFTGNVATEHGNFHEAGARFDFELETGLTVTDAPFVAYEDWAGATPDGYIGDDALLEIKCPFGIRNDMQPVFKSVADQPHYHAQMQFQMFVTSRAKCYFWQWTPRGSDLTIVHADPDWTRDSIPRLRQFHAEFLDDVANNPDEHLVPKRVTIDTPAAHKMVAEWDELAEAIANATARKAELLADMVALAGGKNALIANRKLTLTKRAGAISYGKAIKALLPKADLEPYRGKGSESWGLR